MSAPLDFLAVGHLTVDHLESGSRLGGAAAYAALTAHRLGLRAGIVTSVGNDFPFWKELEPIDIKVVEAPRTTTFENLYHGETRLQRVLSQAAPLGPHCLEGTNLRAGASTLYCPVVHETQTPFVALTDGGLSGILPQGLFRQWDAAGVVSGREWQEAESALAGADFVCMSERDAVAPEEIAETFPGRAFVITRGADGCRLYSQGDVYGFSAVPANAVDPTGAGDVFAAAFLIALAETRPFPAAARFAAAAAALSVEGNGTSAIPTREQIEARLQR